MHIISIHWLARVRLLLGLVGLATAALRLLSG